MDYFLYKYKSNCLIFVELENVISCNNFKCCCNIVNFLYFNKLV